MQVFEVFAGYKNNQNSISCAHFKEIILLLKTASEKALVQ